MPHEQRETKGRDLPVSLVSLGQETDKTTKWVWDLWDISYDLKGQKAEALSHTILLHCLEVELGKYKEGGGGCLILTMQGIF